MRGLLGIDTLSGSGQYDSAVEDQAFTVAELAQMLRISEWKARELGKDPSFPSFKVGNRHRFWPSEVRAHFERTAALRDPWKQSPQSLGRNRNRDAGVPSQFRRTVR